MVALKPGAEIIKTTLPPTQPPVKPTGAGTGVKVDKLSTTGKLGAAMTANAVRAEQYMGTKYQTAYTALSSKIKIKLQNIAAKEEAGTILTEKETQISKSPSWYVMKKYSKLDGSTFQKTFPGISSAAKSVKAGAVSLGKKVADTPAFIPKEPKGTTAAKIAVRWSFLALVTGAASVVAYGFIFSNKGALASLADALPDDSMLKTVLDLIQKWKWIIVILIAVVLFYIAYRFSKRRGWL